MSVSSHFKPKQNAILTFVVVVVFAIKTKEWFDLISIPFVWMDIAYFPFVENSTGGSRRKTQFQPCFKCHWVDEINRNNEAFKMKF